MVKIEIDVSQTLITKFVEAVGIYNNNHNTNVTPKQALLILLRRFTKDTIRTSRVKTAQDLADEELGNL